MRTDTTPVAFQLPRPHLHTGAIRTASMLTFHDSSLDASSQHSPAILGEGLGGIPTDRHFRALRAACQVTGGIARGDDLARLLEDQQRGDFVTLARLIVSGDIFGFEWRDTFWIPMFQFDLRDLSTKHGPRQVLNELGTAFDGWELAVWFVQPNSWLNDRSPVDLLDTQLSAVLEAARADRFIVTG